MTNVLIPTDFTLDSLDMAEQSVRVLGRKMNIVLFHAFDMPFYYQDMVRMEHHPYHSMISEEFRDRCDKLKEQYPKLINKLNMRCMVGNSVALFKNFLDANQIDLIVSPRNYTYRQASPDSLNPLPFFNKSGIALLQDLNPPQKILVKVGGRVSSSYTGVY